MYTLKNEALEVAILDPVADRERFGTRYCTGGYIFQIADLKHGPLLSGPTYPDSFNTFDGQGIPDAFNNGPLRDTADTSATALIIGIGPCDLKANTVLEFCRWDIAHTDARIAFRTSQTHQSFALELDRDVFLCGRTVRSRTRLKNMGKRPIPLRWFPHPFFPQPDTDELCRFNVPVQFPDNPGYEHAESGFIRRKNWPWSEGHYQALDHDAYTSLTVLQKHPALGLVAASCSYTPDFFPIWGNPRTFSWEPYFERTLAPGQETTWWIDYDF